MVNQGMNIVGTALEGWLDFFSRIIEAIPGSLELIIAGFSVFLVTQMLLIPLRGGRFGSSDRAKKVKNSKNSNQGMED